MPRLTTERLVDRYWELVEKASETQNVPAQKLPAQELRTELAECEKKAVLFDRWKAFLGQASQEIVWETLEQLLVQTPEQMVEFSHLWGDTFPLGEPTSSTSLKALPAVDPIADTEPEPPSQ